MTLSSSAPAGTPAPGSPRRRPAARLLVRRKQAARLCAVGVATWDRWTAAGLNPRPTKIAGAVLWGAAELAAWCRHGCPPRAEWEPVWATLTRRAR
jgi:predicted DNA-binding transcriptional regulator AlpA